MCSLPIMFYLQTSLGLSEDTTKHILFVQQQRK